jgi:CubicO group peptidase (beta-lactamase class C family)
MRVLALSFAIAVSASAQTPPAYPHEREPIGSVRQIYDGVLTPEMAVNTFRNIHRLFPTRRVPASATPIPLPAAESPLTNVSFAYRDKQYSLDEFLSANRVTGLLVLHDGRVGLERYLHGNTPRTRWMSMSIAKSVTSTLIGAAVKQGRLALTDPVTKHVPALAGSAYDGATVRDVLMMSSGVRWTETYTNPASDRRALLERQISQVPGSAMALMKSLPRAFEPGTRNTYNTGETQVAAEILRSAVGQSAADYLSDRIWSRAGMESDALWWLDSPNGVEIGGSGLSATLRDFGRFGLFMLNNGVVASDSILPAGWVAEATSAKTLKGGQPLNYGYLWWTATTPDGRRDRAFSADGIHGQFIYINPAAKVVIVLWSAQPKPTGGAVVDEWAFFEAVVRLLK